MKIQPQIKQTLKELADWARREIQEHERHREVMREIWAAREALEARLKGLRDKANNKSLKLTREAG